MRISVPLNDPPMRRTFPSSVRLRLTELVTMSHHPSPVKTLAAGQSHPAHREGGIAAWKTADLPLIVHGTA